MFDTHEEFSKIEKINISRKEVFYTGIYPILPLPVMLYLPVL